MHICRHGFSLQKLEQQIASSIIKCSPLSSHLVHAFSIRVFFFLSINGQMYYTKKPYRLYADIIIPRSAEVGSYYEFTCGYYDYFLNECESNSLSVSKSGTSEHSCVSILYLSPFFPALLYSYMPCADRFLV